jgi:Mn2+/Fe2+ NRAMP family transporter
MTATDTAESDKAVGFTMLFGVLAVLGALVMGAAGFVATGSLRGGIDVGEATTHAMEVNAAVGFALAMTFAVLAVVAVQYYE